MFIWIVPDFTILFSAIMRLPFEILLFLLFVYQY